MGLPGEKMLINDINHHVYDEGASDQVLSFYLAHRRGEFEYGNCKVPTMGVWSSGDVYLWESWMTETEKLLDAECRYERIEGASHWMMLDRPEAVTNLLLDWFS